MKEFVDVFPAAQEILAALAVYFLVIIGVGFWTSRKVQNTEDMILAGRGLPLHLLVPSIVATWVGAATIIGVASETWAFGLQGVVMDPFSIIITMLLMGFLFAHRWRKARFLTTTDYFKARFGTRTEGLFAVIQWVGAVMWIAGQLVALGILVKMATGFPMVPAILIGMVAIVIVVLMGGLHALARTDTIALIIIVIGVIAIAPFGLRAAGGWENFFANAGNWSELPPFSLKLESPDNGGFFWYTGLSGLFYMIISWTALTSDVCNVTLGMRALSAKDSRTASTGFIIAAILYPLIALVPIFIGMVVFQVNPDIPIQSYGDAFPWFIANFVPGWLSAVLVVAIAAAIVSTTGDNVLAAATLLARNLILRNREHTSEQLLKWIRLGTVLVVVLAFLTGVYVQVVYKLVVIGGLMMLPTLFAAFMIGTFWKKANGPGAFWSGVAGLVTWLIGAVLLWTGKLLVSTVDGPMSILDWNFIDDQLMEGWAIWDTAVISSFPALLVSIIVLIVVSLATQKSHPPKEMTDVDGNPVKTGLFPWSKDSREEAEVTIR